MRNVGQEWCIFCQKRCTSWTILGQTHFYPKKSNFNGNTKSRNFTFKKAHFIEVKGIKKFKIGIFRFTSFLLIKFHTPSINHSDYRLFMSIKTLQNMQGIYKNCRNGETRRWRVKLVFWKLQLFFWPSCSMNGRKTDKHQQSETFDSLHLKHFVNTKSLSFFWFQNSVFCLTDTTENHWISIERP